MICCSAADIRCYLAPLRRQKIALQQRVKAKMEAKGGGIAPEQRERSATGPISAGGPAGGAAEIPC
jgi:hypothetical protein